MKVLKTAKGMIDRHFGKKTLTMSDLPAGTAVVSFDIFDTLVVRSVNEPKDIFRLMEKETGIEGFYEKRIEAERKARSKKQSKEVTLEEIYACFNGVSENEINEFCERELDTELGACKGNERLIRFYNECVKKKKVILVSDMYLTSEMMRKILDRCGITGYDGLFISGEIGASKRSGELYRYVLNRLGVKKNRVTHIGNDILSDYIIPKREGMHAIKIHAVKEDVPVRQHKERAVLEVNVDDQNYGGVFSLVRSVVSNNDSGIRMDIAAIEKYEHRENVRFLQSFGCRLYYVGASCGKLRKQLIVFKKLRTLIKREGYQCVHIHADTANKLLISGLSAKTAGVPKVILHSHSSGIDGGRIRLKLIIHRLCRRLLKYVATDFVSCSELATEWMFPNVDRSRVKIINNGVALDRFRFNEEVRCRVRKELGIDEEILVGHVGRFIYQKNHEYLIDIMKRVTDDGINAKLLLIGTGVDEDAIRAKTESLGLSDRVLFYGTSDRVNELMQAMDVFVMPSRFEGLPIVGVEAQAAGLPVVFSDKITREAAVLKNAVFCPITKAAVQEWAEHVKRCAEQQVPRSQGAVMMKERGFDISDVVAAFLELYS